MPSHRWKGFRSVLCPIDFSETSKRALQCAGEVAARADARLVAIYSADPLVAAAARTALHDSHFLENSRRELARFVHAALGEERPPGARLVCRVFVGDPADEIVKRARAVSLIVMGTHGATGARRLMLGSTTLDVLRRTRVPVLAIPPAADRQPWRPLTAAGGPVVAAIELGARARRDVDTAATIALWLAAPLLLVHVVGSIDGPAWMNGALSAHQRIQLGKAGHDLLRLVAVARRRVGADGRVVCGRPADEIAAVVAAADSKLLVTTLGDRRGWFGSRRGDLSYHVLSHAVVPVLACPPQWRPR